jgi:hypothetical protein
MLGIIAGRPFLTPMGTAISTVSPEIPLVKYARLKIREAQACHRGLA